MGHLLAEGALQKGKVCRNILSERQMAQVFYSPTGAIVIRGVSFLAVGFVDR